MEETNDVIPVNNGEKSQQVYLDYVITSSFVATNNKNFKYLKIWQISTYDIKNS